MTWWDGAEAVLNAVVGDYLDARGSDLAIEMGLYHRGQPLAELPRGATRLCVLVHGMARTERCWTFPDDPEIDFGTLLERDRGLAPLYVRYNTGLPVWDSGRHLASLLESVVARMPIDELTLIGHSLGGLVIRSACHQAGEHEWLGKVRRAFYIASPHRGSPVEKAGHLAASVLRAINDPVVKMLGDLAEIRSAAVKNMRHGDVVESREPVPLDDRIEHFLVAGSLPGPLAAVLGDGLVREGSATGVAVPSDHIGTFAGVNHIAILHHPDVYQWISSRCGPPASRRPAPAEVTSGPEARRLEAYLELLSDAVDGGSSAVQSVHEAMAARPYQLLELIAPLRGPVRAVGRLHRASLRRRYGTVRLVNDVVRAALRRAGRERE